MAEHRRYNAYHRSASMRPRVFPADNTPRAVFDTRAARTASMRPRVFPADNFRAGYMTWAGGFVLQ